MTVTAQTPYNTSIAAAGATVFPYGFKIVSATDMRVLVDGVVKTLGVDFTISGVGQDGGGNITFVTPLTGGQRVLRKSDMAYERTTDYQNLGDLHAATLNNDQDSPVLMIRQLAGKFDQALQVPEELLGRFNVTIPVIQVPLAPLVLNAAGNAFEYGSTVLTGDMLLRPNLAQASGSSMVGFIQSGTGAQQRTVQARGRDTLHAADFGVVGDNATNNNSALAAVIAEAKTRLSADILLPQGEIKHSLPIIIDESDIRLIGWGGNIPHDAGTGVSPGTVFVYTGGATEAQVSFQSPTGETAQKKSGGGIQNCWIYDSTGGSAGIGLLVRSYNGGHFADLWSVGHSGASFQIDINAGTMAENKDSQRNRFINCQGEPTAAGTCWYLEGGPSANASFNTFMQCGGRHTNGYGWILGNSDNNLFVQCGAFRLPGGTGYTVEFRGANPGAGHARSNHFINLSGNGGVVARGTTSYTTPSERNTVTHYDQDNSSPLPVIEPDAQLTYATDDGVSFNEGHVLGTFADSLSSAKAQRAVRGTETLRIHNGSENHVALTDGTNSWLLRITSADGALHIDRAAGTGYLFLGGDVQFGSFGGAADQAITGYITIKDAAGNLRKLATIA